MTTKIAYHFGLSGGKDSTALWGWAINESGYPRECIRGSFADTKNEYPEVYEQIAALDAYGQAHGVHPVRTMRSMGFLALAKKKQRLFCLRATSPISLKCLLRILKISTIRKLCIHI